MSYLFGRVHVLHLADKLVGHLAKNGKDKEDEGKQRQGATSEGGGGA